MKRKKVWNKYENKSEKKKLAKTYTQKSEKHEMLLYGKTNNE